MPEATPDAPLVGTCDCCGLDLDALLDAPLVGTCDCCGCDDLDLLDCGDDGDLCWFCRGDDDPDGPLGLPEGCTGAAAVACLISHPVNNSALWVTAGPMAATVGSES